MPFQLTWLLCIFWSINIPLLRTKKKHVCTEQIIADKKSIYAFGTHDEYAGLLSSSNGCRQPITGRLTKSVDRRTLINHPRPSWLQPPNPSAPLNPEESLPRPLLLSVSPPTAQPLYFRPTRYSGSLSLPGVLATLFFPILLCFWSYISLFSRSLAPLTLNNCHHDNYTFMKIIVNYQFCYFFFYSERGNKWVRRTQEVTSNRRKQFSHTVLWILQLQKKK